MRPTSLDHDALWTAERDRHAAPLWGEHLGMHELERTHAFTLVGVDARESKLTLFDAPGPRDVGTLVRVALRVGDLAAALDRLPDELLAARVGGVVELTAPEGLVLGLVERHKLSGTRPALGPHMGPNCKSICGRVLHSPSM